MLLSAALTACTGGPTPSRSAAPGTASAGPVSPTIGPSPSPGGAVSGSPSQADPADLADLPSLLIAGPDPAGGTGLWLTASGRPDLRTRLALPAGGWRPDAASHEAVALTATSGPPRLLVAALEGTRLIPGPPLALPPALEQDTSETGFVACLAATGDLLFADQGVALHVIRSDGTVGPTVPAATRGSCAWLGTDAVLFDVEETHHLGRWRPGHQDVALSDLQLTTPSVGRALVAALSDDDAPGRVVVVRTPTGPDSGRLDLQVVATLRPADGDAYQGLALSSDDAWLVAWGGLDGGATAWFDAYRWGGSAFSLAGRSALGPGEDVRTIGAGG